MRGVGRSRRTVERFPEGELPPVGLSSHWSVRTGARLEVDMRGHFSSTFCLIPVFRAGGEHLGPRHGADYASPPTGRVRHFPNAAAPRKIDVLGRRTSWAGCWGCWGALATGTLSLGWFPKRPKFLTTNPHHYSRWARTGCCTAPETYWHTWGQ